MYIMFPIGWMYYFGTNLEDRFTVPDFWPRPEQSHKIPFERDEINAELARMKSERSRIQEAMMRQRHRDEQEQISLGELKKLGKKEE